MSPLAWIGLYSAAILIASLAGGSVPLLKRVSHERLQLYVSLSAGVMLGAACFHVLPDAVASIPSAFGWWVALGVVGLFLIERFLAPHAAETGDLGAHAPAPSSNAPPVAGWTAVLGLGLHTLMNGVGLAGAVQFDLAHPGARSLPGLALFLAIVLHKPADALAISTVLRRRNVRVGIIGLVQLSFAAMVPVGALALLATRGAFASGMESQVTGAALAFSAGTFLFIALSDLLPEVHFHRHDRVPLFLALLAGVAFMGAIALLEPHDVHRQSHRGGTPDPRESAIARRDAFRGILTRDKAAVRATRGHRRWMPGLDGGRATAVYPSS